MDLEGETPERCLSPPWGRGERERERGALEKRGRGFIESGRNGGEGCGSVVAAIYSDWPIFTALEFAIIYENAIG